MAINALRSKDNNKKRLRALLARASNDTFEYNTCPDPNDMAAYAQGALEPKERKRIEAHLAVCLECHEDYLDLKAMLSDETEKPSAFAGIKTVISQLSDRFKISPAILMPGLAAAAAACLVVFIWVFQSPSLPHRLAETYSPKVIAEISTDDQHTGHMLPWEQPETSLGFAPEQKADPDAVLAFGAGLWSARKDLTGEPEAPPALLAQKWPETQWAVDYWLGRWSYLTQAAAGSNKPMGNDFWKQQSAIIDQLLAKYADTHQAEATEYVSIVPSSLSRIQSIIKHASGGSLNPESLRDIGTELDQLIVLLSPGYNAVYP